METVTCRQVEHVVGKLVWQCLTTRPLLSCLGKVYAFIQSVPERKRSFQVL